MNLLTGLIVDNGLPWFVGVEGLRAYERRNNYIILDFETTNLTNGLAVNPDNSLVLACWTVVVDGKVEHKSLFGDEYDMGQLLTDIASAEFLVAHNAKFELQWLARCGLDLRSVLVYDTMVAEWVIAGNRKMPFNLEDTAQRYKLGGKESLVSKLIKYGVCPSLIPRSWLLKYCARDVEVCHKLFLEQCEKLDVEDLWHIVLARNLIIPALADIEVQGLHLDKARVYAEEARLKAVIEETGEKLDAITGGINLGSPKQLRDLLYSRLKFDPPLDNGGEVMLTGGGDISTAVPALAKLVAETDEQKNFLDLYREYNLASSLLSKNINYFKLVCDQKNGVLFGSLNHCRTANHRLASGGIKQMFSGVKTALACQLQNLPRRYKSLFTTHNEDEVVTEYDGSQIEFRVAAELGHDEVATSDIVNGVDIHTFTMNTLNEAYGRFDIRGVDGEIKSIDRQAAKPNTFQPLYFGMGKDKAEQEYAQAWRTKYPNLFQTQTDWTLQVADRKKLTTPYGLTFHWPSAKMHRSGYVSFSTEIFNLPISGFATGEIIPISLVHFWHRTKGMPVTIFNTVHDSICVRQHKDVVDEVTQIAKKCMTHDVYAFLKEVYRYEFSVPLGFGAKTGTHWGESSTEYKYDVWPDGNERLQIEENKKTRLEYDTRLTTENN